MNNTRILWPYLCFLSLLILNSCGEDHSSSSTAPTYDEVWENVISGNCSTSSCHSSQDEQGGVGPLLGEKNLAYEHLVGKKPAVDFPDWILSETACRQEYLIKPNHSEQSLAFAVVNEDAARQFAGECTPNFSGHLVHASLTSNQQDTLKRWIDAGATR